MRQGDKTTTKTETFTSTVTFEIYEMEVVSYLDNCGNSEAISFGKRKLKIVTTSSKKKKEKAKKNEPELKPVKEVPIAENEEGSKNETGCVIS